MIFHLKFLGVLPLFIFMIIVVGNWILELGNVSLLVTSTSKRVHVF